MTRIVFAAAWIAALAAAQWLDYPTSGIPRTADGKADLTAPAPRTPDGKPGLSGLWRPISRNFGEESLEGQSVRNTQFWDLGVGFPGGLPYQPWARDLMTERKEQFSKDNPDVGCFPLGILQMQTHPFMRRIMQAPDYLAILHERNMEYRLIYTDGRPLPQDPQPSWNGYSSGKWDGDTLVVETIGFRDGLWADYNGSPVTDAARITERFRRPNFGTLEVEVTVDDPKAYTRPWTVTLLQTFVADSDLIEYVCLENEKDLPHMVGK